MLCIVKQRIIWKLSARAEIWETNHWVSIIDKNQHSWFCSIRVDPVFTVKLYYSYVAKKCIKMLYHINHECYAILQTIHYLIKQYSNVVQYFNLMIFKRHCETRWNICQAVKWCSCSVAAGCRCQEYWSVGCLQVHLLSKMFIFYLVKRRLAFYIKFIFWASRLLYNVFSVSYSKL